MNVLYILVVGLIAGWAAGKILKGSGFGVFTDILLGMLGALIGNRVLGLLGLYLNGGLVTRILVAIVGAVILVALIRLIKRA